MSLSECGPSSWAKMDARPDTRSSRSGRAACCGGRKCSTIRCLVLLTGSVPRVGTPDNWYQFSPGRSCFSMCREPQLDAGHPLASQQRWCDESYLAAHLRGLPNASAHGPKHGLCQVIWAYHLLTLHHYFTLFIAPVDTRRPRQKEHYMTTSNPTSAHSPQRPHRLQCRGYAAGSCCPPAWQRDESCFQDNRIHRLCRGGHRRAARVLPRQYH